MADPSNGSQAPVGRVNMDRLLERRPLLPAERQAQPAVVCVTGECGSEGHARLGTGL